jgi:putative FmdB family regulatory protein
MPTYEYICSKCDHQFELFQSITDEPLTICPKELCGLKKWGKGKVKKVIGAGAGLIFKGSGFYITDYRSEKYKEAAKKESAAAEPAKGESTSASGSQSKATSSKAETKPTASSPSKSKPAKD